MNNKTFYIAAILLTLILGRVLPHPWNMTPTLALGLYCSRWLEAKQALWVSLVGFAIGDIALAIMQHHSVWGSWSVFTYSGLFCVTWLGTRITSHRLNQQLLLILSSSLFYWCWTNFGCWLTMPYAKDISGFLSCYTLALPFLKNQIIGDSLWFFAAYYSTVKINKALSTAQT